MSIRRVLFWIPALTLVYALTLASFDPWDLAIGAVLGVGVMAVFWRYPLTETGEETGLLPSPDSRLPSRSAAFFWLWPFLAVLVWEIVKGTWQVTLVVIGRVPADRAGFVEIPIGERTPQGVAVFGLATTLSPGSVLVNVDWNERLMLYHVLDASDPEVVRAQFAWLYERWQRRVVP